MRHCFAILVVLCPLIAMAATPGTAKGTITFNGKSKNLAYAYAWKEPDSFAKGVINTVVLLSDTKLDDQTMADRFSRTDAARKGKFTGVLVTIHVLHRWRRRILCRLRNAQVGEEDADREQGRGETLGAGRSLLQNQLRVFGDVRRSNRTDAEG